MMRRSAELNRIKIVFEKTSASIYQDVKSISNRFDAEVAGLFPFPKKKGQQTICGTTKFALHAA
jgi:hypothetical protein